MRTWKRLNAPQQCGYCGRQIPTGDPALLITFGGVARSVWRCAADAGEPVDAERLAIQDEAQAAERPRFEFTGVTRDLLGEAGE